MKNYEIQSALIGDQDQLAKVHIQAWQEAYAELIPQSYLDGLSAELDERTENWRRALVNPERWIWVARVSGKIVGFSLFGPPRDQLREKYIELGAIYLLAEYKGQGIGFALLQAGFRFMRKQGYQKAYCWVLQGNPTIRFYERSGAVFRGLVKVDKIGEQDFRELVYEWDEI